MQFSYFQFAAFVFILVSERSTESGDLIEFVYSVPQTRAATEFRSGLFGTLTAPILYHFWDYDIYSVDSFYPLINIETRLLSDRAASTQWDTWWKRAWWTF